MSRSEEAMGGEYPDTGKGTCRRPRGKRRLLHLKSPNKGCYGWNLEVWGRMESGKAAEKGKNIK